MATQPICQFYAELRGYEPRIWRRFQVARNITLARLGYILMTLFEMRAEHLFAFEEPNGHNLRCWIEAKRNPRGERSAREMDEYISYIWGDIYDNTVTRYELPEMIEELGLSDDDEESTQNVIPYRLSKCLSSPGQIITFYYDFGDDWAVDVRLEAIIRDSALPGRELPRALEGEGFGIIEDCGGALSLRDLREAFLLKSGSKYKELCEWLGTKELDLDTFDLADMNLRLQKLPRIFKQIYEERLEPTEQSIQLINRAYKA